MTEYQNLKSLTEKRKFLSQIKGQTDKTAVLQTYKLIMAEKAEEDGYECLTFALENNVGGIFPPDRTKQFEKQLIEWILQACNDFAYYGLYCRFFKLHFDTMDNANSPEYKTFMKLIGEYVDKLIVKRRMEGVLSNTFHIQHDQFTSDPKVMEMQSVVVDMIINLTPIYLQLNPELFPLVLNVFTSGISPENYNGLQLEQLSKVIQNQCTYEENYNNDHDWMMLLSALFEQVYRGAGVGMIFILKQIKVEVLIQIIMTNQKYLLLNYFQSPESTVQIFNGLTKYYITPTNLEIILQISRLLYNQAQKGSEIHVSILRAVYLKFILTRILSNIQMFNVQKEIIELLEFYMIGLCRVEKIPDGTIQLMSKRLRLLLTLHFQSRDFTRPVFQFIETLRLFYPSLQNNPEILAVLKMCQEKSMYPLTASNLQAKQSMVWQIDLKNMKGSVMNFQLLQKDSSQYVGLENLGNSKLIILN